MANKEVEQILIGSPFHMVGDGFRVSNYFPNGNPLGNKISPFILLDYHPSYYYPPTHHKRGVGVHPHRGFETVTLAMEGFLAHKDSFENSGIIGPGDVQWMTAASGVLHTEYHEEKFSMSGGNMQMLQLWVNLPATAKMSTPKYQAITANQMGQFLLPDNFGAVHIIAGNYEGVKGPASTFTPINLYRVELKQGAIIKFEFLSKHNTSLLITNGEIIINDNKTAKTNEFVIMNHRGEQFQVKALTDAQFIVLDGEPIDEPVVQYGPFVMNTADQINEAIDDFNQGKFGVLTVQ